jgi:type I restriction enzyme, S subunit
MILITCSGTIGKVNITPQHWDGWAANQHVMRVVPANDSVSGYLYCWLSSIYCEHLIKRFTYGAVVDELDANHVAQIPLPIPIAPVFKEINSLISKANELRYEAYCFEKRASDQLDSQVLKIQPSFLSTK